MFRRWQEARKISQQERAAIAAAARAEVQRAWSEWYRRQTEAHEKGQPFTEPPPTLNGDTYEE